MLRKIWIVLGAVALIAVVYVTAFAVEEVQRPRAAEDSTGDTVEATTWTVCSSGCDFTSIQAAVDAASDGDTIELGPESFSEDVAITKDLIIEGSGRDDTYVGGVLWFGHIAYYGAPLELGSGALTGITANGVEKIGSGDLAIEDARVFDRVGVGGVWQDDAPTNVAITRTIIEGRNPYEGLSVVGRGGYPRMGLTYVKLSDSQVRGQLYGVFGYMDFDMAIENTTITGARGAVVHGSNRLIVRGSTIVGESGLGLASNHAQTSIQGSTISGESEEGLRIESGQVVVRDSTIDGGNGVGLKNISFTDIELDNSIVIGATDDCLVTSGSVTTTRSLFNQDGCGGTSVGDITNTDPLLLPLADNGGPTPTFALDPASPAIDAGGVECLPTDQRGARRPQDGDDDGAAECDIGAYEVGVLSVEASIDIKPDNFSNTINPYSRGVIPVAILGSDTFDVADVDVTTLAFSPAGASIAHRHGHLQDVNYDGIMDLMTHYRTQETGIVCGDESATLAGETLEGQSIEGTDSIQTVGCRETRRPAIWMKDMDRLGKPRSDGPVNVERR